MDILDVVVLAGRGSARASEDRGAWLKADGDALYVDTEGSLSAKRMLTMGRALRQILTRSHRRRSNEGVRLKGKAGERFRRCAGACPSPLLVAELHVLDAVWGHSHPHEVRRRAAPRSQAVFDVSRFCFYFQSRGPDPLRGGGRAPTDLKIKIARPRDPVHRRYTRLCTQTSHRTPARCVLAHMANG